MSRRTNRELVMLAQTYVPGKHRTAGMYMSEKLDGMRCLWLPATRGKLVENIPFANRDKDSRKHKATGLWSRYGKVLHCPDFFVEGFPDYPLDGELYLGRSGFQQLMSIVKKLEPDESDWKFVTFQVLDAPRYRAILADGKINNPQYSKTVSLADNMKALGIDEWHPAFEPVHYFEATYKLLKKELKITDYLKVHEQVLLPFSTPVATGLIEDELNRITSLGGEGLILRHPSSFWEPIRSVHTLKIKKLHDAEGLISGYKAGEIGTWTGMLGSIVIKWSDNITFDLSGFNASERTLTPEGTAWALANPSQYFPPNMEPCVKFKRGEQITFRYRELTDGNKPKEARFLRKREPLT